MRPRLMALALLVAAAEPMAASAQVRAIAPGGPPVAISPGLFGVNYVWHLVPGTVFPAFAATLRTLGATLVRYPGGWAAERYDWTRNAPLDGDPPEAGPGVAPDTLLATFAAASFVTPSRAAIRDPRMADNIASLSADLAKRFGTRVRLWEIGNEWWLQRGAKHDPAMRARNLAAYAALVARVAPAIKRVQPDAVVFATGEWTHPEDFATLRQDVGPAWSAVDGLSIHPYCGTLDPQSLCEVLPARAAEIRAAGGKSRLYASEWSLGARVTQDDWGIRNANRTVAAFLALITAHVEEAAYWPPMRGAPPIALMLDNGRATATGMLFGWMAHAMRGELIPAGGLAAVARARGRVSMIIPSVTSGPVDFAIALPAWGVRHVVEAEVMASADPDDPAGGRDATLTRLPVSVAGGTIRFRLNPGGAGRSAGWEIARIVLQ